MAMRWLEPVAISIAAWVIAISSMERAFPNLIGSPWMIVAASPLAVLLAMIFAVLALLIHRPLVGHHRFQ